MSTENEGREENKMIITDFKWDCDKAYKEAFVYLVDPKYFENAKPILMIRLVKDSNGLFCTRVRDYSTGYELISLEGAWPEETAKNELFYLLKQYLQDCLIDVDNYKRM
jgi:hypothetical protein